MSRPFNKEFINLVGKQVEKLVVERMDKIAINVHSRLSFTTPVDTGQARAGWNFTLNKMDKSYPKASGRSIPAKPSEPDQRATKMSDRYNLTNAVPHLPYLNEGSSAKAPANFIEREVVAGSKIK